MNEQTTKLIEQLALKLGTTTEYLWSVLLKQAYISAITTLIYLVGIIGAGFLLLKAHIAFSKETEESNSKYWDSGELQFIMIALAFIWSVLFIVAFFSIENIVNGFLNPEYWALKEIMSNL